jgi:hypothetical protein
MLAPLLKYSTDWKGKDVWKLPRDVLDVADKQIGADAYRIGSDPSLMQELEGAGSRLREIRRRDPTGRDIIQFVGPISETLAPFKMPAFRVKRINTHIDPAWR